MAASDLGGKAKEAFVDDDFELAAELYTQAIDAGPATADLYADRAQAHIKLGNYTGKAALFPDPASRCRPAEGPIRPCVYVVPCADVVRRARGCPVWSRSAENSRCRRAVLGGEAWFESRFVVASRAISCDSRVVRFGRSTSTRV